MVGSGSPEVLNWRQRIANFESTENACAARQPTMQKKRCHRIVAHRIEARRLKPESPTRRMVAGCCDTPMFLDFTKAHWLTIFLQGRA
jgi:hypothetical protein